MELERLHTIEQLRETYESHLADKHAQTKKERQQADSWILDLKESNPIEKRSYDERIGQM